MEASAHPAEHDERDDEEAEQPCVVFKHYATGDLHTADLEVNVPLTLGRNDLEQSGGSRWQTLSSKALTFTYDGNALLVKLNQALYGADKEIPLLKMRGWHSTSHMRGCTVKVDPETAFDFFLTPPPGNPDGGHLDTTAHYKITFEGIRRHFLGQSFWLGASKFHGRLLLCHPSAACCVIIIKISCAFHGAR